MNRRVAIGGGIAGLLLSTGLAHGENDFEIDNNFDGKYLVIYSKSEKERSSYLRNVRLKKLGDRDFLVGGGFNPGTSKEGEAYEGLIHWVALDDIAMIQVFPSRESLRDVIGLGKSE